MSERYGLQGLTSDTLVALCAEQLHEIAQRRTAETDILARIPTHDIAAFAQMFNDDLARRAKQRA